MFYGVVICLERGANYLHMVQLMPMPPRHLLLQQNPEWCTFWYRPTKVHLEKRPLNGCLCVGVRSMIRDVFGSAQHEARGGRAPSRVLGSKRRPRPATDVAVVR